MERRHQGPEVRALRDLALYGGGGAPTGAHALCHQGRGHRGRENVISPLSLVLSNLCQ